jgi:hypothetical protein
LLANDDVKLLCLMQRQRGRIAWRQSISGATVRATSSISGLRPTPTPTSDPFSERWDWRGVEHLCGDQVEVVINE